MDQDADFRTWNVFRRRKGEQLCCAVSADAPVPSFLLSGDWSFGFALAESDAQVTCFSAAAAETGTASEGFYLFLAATPPRGRRDGERR